MILPRKKTTPLKLKVKGKHSFKKGLTQLKLSDLEVAKIRICQALGLKTPQAWWQVASGNRRTTAREREIIATIFEDYGITDIWESRAEQSQALTISLRAVERAHEDTNQALKDLQQIAREIHGYAEAVQIGRILSELNAYQDKITERLSLIFDTKEQAGEE